MEIRKVIRIVALSIVLAAFAVQTASLLMFPDASHTASFPIALLLLVCLASIWRDTNKKKYNLKKHNLK